MASSLRSNLNFLSHHPSKAAQSVKPTRRLYIPVRCGRRDNRGPLVRGRILSIEAIQAVQVLKRAHKADPTTVDTHLSKTISRLIKSDLIAVFKELLRQERCDLALKVFSAVRSEYSPDLSLHADLVSTLGKQGLTEEIDSLVGDLERESVIDCDDKGLIALVKALIASGRTESTVRIYRLMKRSGWGSTYDVDEYVAKALSRGLRTMGEDKVADEIDSELEIMSRGILDKAMAQSS